MATFGLLSTDTILNEWGVATNGTVAKLYASQALADAGAAGTSLASVTTGPGGRFEYSNATLATVWARTLKGAVTSFREPGAAADDAVEMNTYVSAFLPEKYGAIGNGIADDTAAINATIAAAMTAGGGTVWLSPKRYLCLGALVTPYTGIPTRPVQKPCRITSAGGATAGFLASAQTPTGAILDLRYDGTDTLHPAKIDTRGSGFLEIDHITIVSGGADDFPICQQTNTTTDIHHNAVFGNAAKSGTACVQDAFIFGGVGDGTDGGSDSATAPFQGYGSKCRDNFFSNIRKGFLGRKFCNDVPVENNTFTTSCGSSTSGAIEFNGQDTLSVGCSTRGNTIEVANYKYGISLYSALNGNFGPDGFYDPTANYTAAVFVGPGSEYNEVIGGYHNEQWAFVVDAAGTTTVRTAHQSQLSHYPQPAVFTHSWSAMTRNSLSMGPVALSSRGDQATVAALDATYGPGMVLGTMPAIPVADGATTSGTAVVTSATAAWTALDVGFPISGAGIPAFSFIVSRESASSVTISANATATATGVALKFGRGGATPTSELMLFKRHLWTQGGTPSGVVGAPAGTEATVTITGTDTAQTVTLTVGAASGTGTQATLTYALAFGLDPVLSLTARNALTAAAMTSLYVWTNGNFITVSAATALPAGVYVFDIHSIA